MSDDFPKPPEELVRVAAEIAKLREELKTASATLARIEKRIKVAYPNYPQSQRTKSTTRNAPRTPSKPRDELLGIYEAVLSATSEQGEDGFESEIAKLEEKDLSQLAFELGISDSRRMSKKKAREGIRRRIHESLLLSRKSPNRRE